MLKFLLLPRSALGDLLTLHIVRTEPSMVTDSGVWQGVLEQDAGKQQSDRTPWRLVTGMGTKLHHFSLAPADPFIDPFHA
jgi:hypothetical protein